MGRREYRGVFFFQAEDGIRDLVRSRGLGDVYKRQPTKERVLAKLPHLYGKSDNIISESLIRITGVPFFNKSKLDMKKLLDDTDNIAINLQSYINDFSPNVQKIIEYFAFSEQIARLQDANLLYMVLQRFVTDELDLSPVSYTHLTLPTIYPV